MIELTDEQIQSLSSAGAPPRAVNPRTRQTFVLLPVEEYERLKGADYDDSPWTREEIEGAAWEASDRLEREEAERPATGPEAP